MSSIKIAMTFANRRYDPDLIELVHAWDEYSIDDNPSGYENTKRAELDALGGELLRWVTVEVNVPYDEIQSTLRGELPGLASSKPVVTSSSDDT